MEVAIEATPSWYWLYDLLEAEGFKVKLSHPLNWTLLPLVHLLRSNLLTLSYVPEKPVSYALHKILDIMKG